MSSRSVNTLGAAAKAESPPLEPSNELLVRPGAPSPWQGEGALASPLLLSNLARRVLQVFPDPCLHGGEPPPPATNCHPA